jgi:hypothetical protein
MGRSQREGNIQKKIYRPYAATRAPLLVANPNIWMYLLILYRGRGYVRGLIRTA